MELLSPAGNLETAVAAFEYGADAVYLGLKQFSARADAENFSDGDLEVLMGYSRHLARPRKVYVAVNTLLREDELPALYRRLSWLNEVQPDALIVQDLAVAGVVRRHFPGLRLHASTQMAVHNAAGVLQCRKLGFERVIAAREVTLNELSAMASVPGIELEAFVHGALCYAYSGLCLLSSVLCGHSGNRGDCSYVCRNCWRVEQGGQVLRPACNLMSMKDLALSDSVGALRRAGVASVKIEGRKKSALYVAAVTNYYRKLLDGVFAPGEREQCEQDLRVIFSRPWTKFCLNAERAAAVTDTATTGPRGTRAGEVTAVVRANGRDLLRFQLQNLPLECHDGLQIEPGGGERPYGFAVESIRVFQQGGNDRGSRVFTASPGMTIEVPLPPDHPDFAEGMPIFCTSSQSVRQRYHWPSLRPHLVRQRVPVDFELSVGESQLALTAVAGFRCGEASCVEERGEEGLAASRRTPEEQSAALRQSLSKLGESRYVLRDCVIDNPGNGFVAASSLNELRRRAVQQLDVLRDAAIAEKAAAAGAAVWRPRGVESVAAASPMRLLKLDRHFLLNLFTPSDIASIGEVIFDFGRTPLNELDDALEYLMGRVGVGRLRLALPVIVRASRLSRLLEAVKRAGNLGVRRWQIANLSHLELLAANGIDPARHSISADWQLYAVNHEAARYLLDDLGLERVTLAPDDDVENTLSLCRILGGRAEAILFQDTPLAISAVCANASLNGRCLQKGACGFTEMKLTDRRGNELLAINDSCQSVYIRQSPLDRRGSQRLFLESGASFLRTDFIWRNWSPAAVKAVWDGN